MGSWVGFEEGTGSDFNRELSRISIGDRVGFGEGAESNFPRGLGRI